MIPILEYADLDVSRVKANYRKVVEAIARQDFRAAQVKKLSNLAHGKFYRAKLDEADRLVFSLVRHEGKVCALMLEVILNHDYSKSRFLRGATIDEDRIPDAEAVEAIENAQEMRYLHPERTAIHLLDKPISFDDAQEAVYRQPPPLIVVGSAGSGKTALTLEKLKNADGEVLYVTHSSYLAQSARDLYYANGFERDGQEAVFLSYREFVETLRLPLGREATWRDFSGWFSRIQQMFKEFDAHQVFEEMRGVIAAHAGGVLTREAYRELGVRQSIFPQEQRDRLYDIFEKYRQWLHDAKLYDLNLVAQEWRSLAAPRYDFVVIDEVQDITMVQLALVLKTLKRAGNFLLCGDSNQIVHPNFFSWAQVKSLFWQDPALAERQELRVLTANFRNGAEATRVANRLLKIKHRRFGSIDRESNFLVQAVGGKPGQVAIMPDKEATKRELNQKIRQSTQFAVLVMRDEDKAEAKRHFSTPLLFSIHEAKGLEYENIVLYRFVSDHRAEFNEIVDGVARADLLEDTLNYRRAKDKTDKSLEIYKFYVNALYVALTRAIENLYIIESDTGHTIWSLLDLSLADTVNVAARESSLEDWQREARKLELQGKQEQAEAIRRDILKETPVPWSVLDGAKVRELMVKVFREHAPGGKIRQQLYEYALCFDESKLLHWLSVLGKHQVAAIAPAQRSALSHKSYAAYFSSKFKDVLKQCELYGVDHRLPMNLTPLMAAAAAGNVALVEALLERGADREAVDHYGQNALHWAMREAFKDEKTARGPFAALYELLAPPSIDVNAGDRLVKIYRHQTEYFLLQTFQVLFKPNVIATLGRGLDTQAILTAWAQLPGNAVRAERKRRQYLSGVLARNERDRDYAYNRRLFMRVEQGHYRLNPQIALRSRQGEESVWTPIYGVLNLALIHETCWDDFMLDFHYVPKLIAAAGLTATVDPVVSAGAKQRREDDMRKHIEERRRQAAAKRDFW